MQNVVMLTVIYAVWHLRWILHVSSIYWVSLCSVWLWWMSWRFQVFMLRPCCKGKKLEPGNTYWSGRISTVDLLVLTSSDQLILIHKNSFHKTSFLNEVVNCTDLSPSVRFCHWQAFLAYSNIFWSSGSYPRVEHLEGSPHSKLQQN